MPVKKVGISSLIKPETSNKYPKGEVPTPAVKTKCGETLAFK
jgi:hypothetical protein